MQLVLILVVLYLVHILDCSIVLYYGMTYGWALLIFFFVALKKIHSIIIIINTKIEKISTPQRTNYLTIH